MLTEEYISFDHITIDHEAANFEANLHEPNDFYESTETVSTTSSFTPLSHSTANKRAADKLSANKRAANKLAADTNATNNAATNNGHDDTEDSLLEEASRPNRSKAEAADATARLASHMRQLSRGLGLGRAGQIQTAQQPSPAAVATSPNSTADIGVTTNLASAANTASTASTESTNHLGSIPNHPTTPLTPGYIASGCPGLERLLPGGGYEPGCLVEWFHSGAGGTAGSLAMLSAIPAMREGKALVIIDWNHTFYPPAAAALGADLKRLVVVRPTSREDGWWSLDQALRCTAVGSVWSELPDEMDDRLARRLQLAAETGGTLGMLIRHSRTRNRPSWADVQWQVRPASHLHFPNHSPNSLPTTNPASSMPPHSGRYVQVDLVRCRSGAGHGGYKRQSIWLELGQPVRPPLSNSIFSAPHESIRSTVKTTWIRELPAPNTLTSIQTKHPASKQGHMRNDSYDGQQPSSYTQRMAAQLAMPTRPTTPATTNSNSTNSAGSSPTRAVSA